MKRQLPQRDNYQVLLQMIRDIIISRVDANYHKKILNVNEPSAILTKIREISRIESNMTDTFVREKLYTIKRDKKEKASDFFHRFDKIVTDYDSCDSEAKMSSEEIRSAFYKAVKESCPELRSAYLVKS